MSDPRFGAQRSLSASRGRRLQFRLFGVADPAHYLHHRYLRRALDRLEITAPRRILDAGCGAGDHSLYLAARYPEAEILAIDIKPDRLPQLTEAAKALGLSNIRFEVGDLTRLKTEREYDLIVCIDVLEHIPEQRTAASNLFRALRPGGLVFAHVPTVREKPVPFSALLRDFHDWAEEEHTAVPLTFERAVALLADCGAEIADARRTFGYWTGELATSLFAMPYRNTPLNRIFQVLLAGPCRMLAIADAFGWDSTRFAAAVCARKQE